MRLINTLFSTIFGRRLGQQHTDGTTLRTDPLSMQLTKTHKLTTILVIITRELTLTREALEIDYLVE